LNLSPQHRAHLRLALVPQLGPRRTRTLLQHFGTPEAALNATESELSRLPNIGSKRAGEFARAFAANDDAVERELEQLDRHGVRLTAFGDDDYPTMLSTIVGAPMLLYVRGEFRPEDPLAVAMVGSRSCTSYGLKAAASIAGGLCRAGRPVISGLARGIDGACHRGALDAGGRTIAVLAGGLAKIYPPEHDKLAAEIVARGGMLLTETPMTVDVQPGMFPARNRIISGLSCGIVVVEANVGSGALITVDHAAEQSREVYVVPGNIDSPASGGCLELIRKGARLIRNAEDLLEDLQGLSPIVVPPPESAKEKKQPALFAPPTPVAPPPPPVGLSPVEQALWDALAVPRHADELTRELNLGAGQLAAPVMKLEMKKHIRRLPGNMLERR